MLHVHLFLCFVRVSFCHFSLPLGVGAWRRFVIVCCCGLNMEFNSIFPSHCHSMFSLQYTQTKSNTRDSNI